jgi:hypothetical protein
MESKSTEIEERNKAYYRFFETDDGKAVLADLEVFCGQLRSSICEEQPDALQLAFCEGKRRVYLRIISLINEVKKTQES